MNDRVMDPARWGRATSPCPQAQLCVEVDDRAAAAGVLIDWFERAWAEFCGPLQDLIVEDADPVDRPRNVVIGGIYVDRQPREKFRVPWSVRSWAELRTLLAELPRYAIATVRVNDAEGRPSRPIMEIESRTIGSWLLLAVAREDRALDTTDDGEESLATFLRSFADICNPGHGEISYASYIMNAALEQTFAALPDETVPRSRQQLRSYSWVTVVPRELGARLGGAEGLTATGAFAAVTELAEGGYWLRATPHWRDYDLTAAERVVAALAPILPPGRPHANLKPWANVVADLDPSQLS